MRRILPALALSAALVTGGCQNPDGSLDVGNTLLLGAGVAAVTALAVGAANSSNRHGRHYASGYGYRQPPPRYGHGGYGYGGGGYGGGYRRW